MARAAIEAVRGLGPDTIGIELIPSPLPDVAGEASVLIEVVTALLANAIEALPDGGTITVRTRASDRHVLCEVRDPGVGMSPRRARARWSPSSPPRRASTRGSA